jgi:hypothetical protein
MLDFIDAVIKKTVDDTISIDLKKQKSEKKYNSIVKNNSNLKEDIQKNSNVK